nr:uncharacterized protein LOC127302650 [Lolium perenne]
MQVVVCCDCSSDRNHRFELGLNVCFSRHLLFSLKRQAEHSQGDAKRDGNRDDVGALDDLKTSQHLSSKERHPPFGTCVPGSKKRQGHGPRQEQTGSEMSCLQPGMSLISDSVITLCKPFRGRVTTYIYSMK